MAIILMVLFHMAFDLNYFGVYEVEMSSGFWFYLARFTASLFLLLVGVSLSPQLLPGKLLGQIDDFASGL